MEVDWFNLIIGFILGLAWGWTGELVNKNWTKKKK